MKVLLIGGTGTISSAITRLSASRGMEVYLLNRGSRNVQITENIHLIQADINDENDVAEKISGMYFDSVADFIAFEPEAVKRDVRLFSGKTRQYIFISSASAYQKPLRNPIITESTPLCNPYWEYSRNKIACEEYLMDQYRNHGFPVTIIRPSHTYCERSMPVAIHGRCGSYSVIKRMLEGKKVIVHGDGTSLWTVTYNTDFAKGFAGLMGNEHALGESYHITSDESLTWNQIYEIIGKTVGAAPDIVHIPSEVIAENYPEMQGALIGDKANTVIFDNTKLKRAVPDFCASVRFDQGAVKVYEYIKSHPECQMEDPQFDRWCDEMIDAYETVGRVGKIE